MPEDGPRKAPMVEWQLLSIPFEAVAVDIVSPFPKGRGGHCYLLTYICLASRWPDAVPMRSMTAKAVGGFVSWTGFPLSLLTDQGTQFTGGMCKELCRMFGVSKLQTTAYRPQ